MISAKKFKTNKEHMIPLNKVSVLLIYIEEDSKMEQEHQSVRKMWEDYLISIGESIAMTDKTYNSGYFCDNEKDADELAELAKEGVKRGTTSLYYWYEVENEERW